MQAYFFNDSADMRWVIYSSDVVASLNFVMLKRVTSGKVSPSDDAAFKLKYFALDVALKKGAMRIS
ncbi:MAG: IS256 family transposase, partial [Pseudomonadales bacterium]|nr:IS256 family transposase [Pseudomonadales bacterium]